MQHKIHFKKRKNILQTLTMKKNATIRTNGS